jgi:hypothetical protein
MLSGPGATMTASEAAMNRAMLASSNSYLSRKQIGFRPRSQPFPESHVHQTGQDHKRQVRPSSD